MTQTATERNALRAAVDLAGYAPSLYNSQPWSWQISEDTAVLSMDVGHIFPITDPQNRELRVGCGAALHHLQVSLAANGWSLDVHRHAGDDDGLLASVRLTGHGDPDQYARKLAAAIPRRRTDRRPFSSRTVDEAALGGLQAAVEGEGVHLQVIAHANQRIWLAVLADRAASVQSAQDGYADELAAVTGGLHGADGVPAATVPHVLSPRHSDVTMRDFELDAPGTLEIPESVDEHPVWFIVWTDSDTHVDWLRAGEAMSRLLLTATERGLATGIQSQPVEVPTARNQIDTQLLSGLGHAQVLVRVGWSGSPDSALPESPRHSAPTA